ncbi:MAG TPA: hypothetical protein VF185_03580 [Patescibacteria group bacterium]
MIQRISEPVSVVSTFNSATKKVYPTNIVWRQRIYKITKIGLHHTYRQGRTLYHVFSVASQNLFFRLVLNSETLFWRLEEISDGLSN